MEQQLIFLRTRQAVALIRCIVTLSLANTESSSVYSKFINIGHIVNPKSILNFTSSSDLLQEETETLLT